QSAVSGQRSAVSGQRSAVSGQRSALAKGHPKRTALWHRLQACDFTQIKPMLTCFIQKLIADN
ncbi:MAG: hypothetical protein F6K50_40255, partial [Moorea sp. SIO3I7]|nr:hypothetical protein [Moorena sp. SIO3I7]